MVAQCGGAASPKHRNRISTWRFATRPPECPGPKIWLRGRAVATGQPVLAGFFLCGFASTEDYFENRVPGALVLQKSEASQREWSEASDAFDPLKIF